MVCLAIMAEDRSLCYVIIKPIPSGHCSQLRETQTDNSSQLRQHIGLVFLNIVLLMVLQMTTMCPCVLCWHGYNK